MVQIRINPRPGILVPAHWVGARCFGIVGHTREAIAPVAQRAHPALRVGSHDGGGLGDLLGRRLHGAGNQFLIRRGRPGILGAGAMVHRRSLGGRRIGRPGRSAQTKDCRAGADPVNCLAHGAPSSGTFQAVYLTPF